MHVPSYFAQHDVAAMHALMRARPLGTWVVVVDAAPVVNHIPFLLDADRGPHGTLVAHVARANPVWHALAKGAPSVVVFHGPDAYVSPAWYPSKAEAGKAVPTWNYAVVHARGVARTIEDPVWLRAHVAALSAAHEATRAEPWTIDDAPRDYVDAMLRGIVGIELPIDTLEGKWKTSQNKTPADQRGVIAGLRDEAGADAMAALVEEHL